MKANKRKSCENIQHLLISGDYGQLSSEEKEQLSVHLSECEACREFEYLLTKFQKTGSEVSAIDRKALNRIKKNILQSFRESEKVKERAEKTLGKQLKKIAFYRVPLYQVVGFFLLIALGSILILQQPVPPDMAGTDNAATIKNDSLYLDNLDVFVNLNYLEQQNIGRNLEEDSVMARYVFKSL